MAIRTTQMSSSTGQYNEGWHQVVINGATYGVWKSPNGDQKRFIDVTFEGYPESMNMRVYETFNNTTKEEFSIANLFKNANAGIIAVLKDPTGKKPVVQFDDEAHFLVGKSINIYMHKDPKNDKYNRIFNVVAPVEQEGEHLSFTAEQVSAMKNSVEKQVEKKLGNVQNNNSDSFYQASTTENSVAEERPF